MQQKRWLVIGGAVVVLGLLAGLGVSGTSSGDEPVRVYLVHDGQHAEHGRNSTTVGLGITVFSTAGGNTWPTQAMGYLEDVDEYWVVLRKADGGDREHEIHIPRERVQLIEHISEERLRLLLGQG